LAACRDALIFRSDLFGLCGQKVYRLSDTGLFSEEREVRTLVGIAPSSQWGGENSGRWQLLFLKDKELAPNFIQ
jgi:hypothetical protein